MTIKLKLKRKIHLHCTEPEESELAEARQGWPMGDSRLGSGGSVPVSGRSPWDEGGRVDGWRHDMPRRAFLLLGRRAEPDVAVHRGGGGLDMKKDGCCRDILCCVEAAHEAAKALEESR